MHTDGEGNIIQSFSNKNKVKSKFFVNGKVETFDTKGIYNNPLDKINLSLFKIYIIDSIR